MFSGISATSILCQSLELGEPLGVSLARPEVIDKSLVNRSRVAGLSGGTISRGGGVRTEAGD
jgi:hypothetical protein